MTPLKPLENLNVHGTNMGPPRYELNKRCAHPECHEPVGGKHHCFPKSQLKGDFWWVALLDFGGTAVVIPNVVGLCGSGTTGHHGDIEGHRSWIRYEDGVYNWYDRVSDAEELYELGMKPDERAWELIGALNPQPGQIEGKPKRKKKTGEARRKRRTISLRVPKDTEDGGALWDELFAELKEACVEDDLFETAEKAAEYETIMAVGRDWLDRRPTWKVV